MTDDEAGRVADDGTVSGPRRRGWRSTGLDLAYLDWGAADAPPVVLVHGIRDHARAWDRIAADLARDHRVIVPDLRGHGRSDWSPDGAYLLPYHVADLLALLDAVGGPPPVLVGHSFGGSASSRVAGLYPDRIAKLAIVDGFGPSPAVYAQWAAEGPVARTRAWIEQRREHEARPPRTLASIEEGAARLAKGNPRLDGPQAHHLAVHGLRETDDGWKWRFDPRVSVFAPEDFATPITDYWRAVTVPTLLLYGAESWSALKPDVDLSSLRDARAVAIPEAGHWPHHDQPDAFLTALRGFLR